METQPPAKDSDQNPNNTLPSPPMNEGDFPENESQRQGSDNGNSKKDNHWVKSDKIAFGGLLINLAMAIVTALLFYYTKKSTDAAVKSADAAIEAVNETKKQFVLLNTPYLGINNIRIIRFAPNDTLKFTADIMSVNKQPVKMYGYTDLVFIAESQPDSSEINDVILHTEAKPLHTYITSEIPYQYQFDGVIFTQKDFEIVLSKKMSIFWIGSVYYIDISNGRERRVIWCFQILNPSYNTPIVRGPIDNQDFPQENFSHGHLYKLKGDSLVEIPLK